MSTPANALDITQAGFVKFDGSTTFTGVTIIPIANGGTNASSFTSTDGIATFNGTRLVNYNSPKISSAGIYTSTTQPILSANQATSQTNATGDGTSFDVIFDNVIDQLGSNYNTSTGKFTCPVTGYYQVTYTVTFTGITSAMDDGYAQILSSAASIQRRSWNAGAMKTAGNEVSISDSVITKRTAGDTLYININIANGAKVASTKQNFFNSFCYLSIQLIA